MTRLAVLIDAENIEVNYAGAVIAHARTLGELNIVRLYGDFSEMRMSGWLDLARARGYQPVLQLNGGRGRNSTDIALTIDAMDLLHAGVVDAYCIVSNDRDFIPLAARLRAQGQRVHIICKHADERMRAVSSDVFCLPAPAAPSKPAPAVTPIVAAFKAISSGAAEMSLSEAAKALRSHAPDLMLSKGKGAVRKLLRASGQFEEVGQGPSLRVRLKR